MKEIVLKAFEYDHYESTPRAKPITVPKPVTIEGRSYSEITYSCNSSAFSHLIKLIEAFVLTILSAGLGLISSDLRALFAGKEKIRVFKPALDADDVEAQNDPILHLIRNPVQTIQDNLTRLTQALSEDDVHAIFELGYLHALLNNNAKSIEYFEKALTTDPEAVLQLLTIMINHSAKFNHKRTDTIEHTKMVSFMMNITKQIKGLCDLHNIEFRLIDTPNFKELITNSFLKLHLESREKLEDRIVDLANDAHLGNAIAHCKIGHLFMVLNDTQEAIDHFVSGFTIKPEVLKNYLQLLEEQKELYNSNCLKINPNSFEEAKQYVLLAQQFAKLVDQVRVIYDGLKNNKEVI